MQKMTRMTPMPRILKRKSNLIRSKHPVQSLQINQIKTLQSQCYSSQTKRFYRHHQIHTSLRKRTPASSLNSLLQKNKGSSYESLGCTDVEIPCFLSVHTARQRKSKPQDSSMNALEISGVFALPAALSDFILLVAYHSV
jgi:hypothetical protein